MLDDRAYDMRIFSWLVEHLLLYEFFVTLKVDVDFAEFGEVSDAGYWGEGFRGVFSGCGDGVQGELLEVDCDAEELNDMVWCAE